MKYYHVFLALVILIPLLHDASALAPIEKGINYDREQVGPNEYVVTSHPERIYDYTGADGKPVWVDYRLFEDASIVQLETANAGTLVFDKNTCSYNFYNGGRVEPGNDPKIKGISWTVKGKEASASTWSNVNGINNAACVVAVSSTESTVAITGTKTNGAGTFQIKIDYSPGRGIKETMRAYNNNPAWNNHNIGFTETFEVPRIIHIGGQEYDLANYNQTILDRDWIENNEAKLVRLSDKIFYDFGIGFDNLNDIKITWTGTVAKLSLNYLYPTQIVPYQTWFEVDPTFGYTAANNEQRVRSTGAVSVSCDNAPYIKDTTTLTSPLKDNSAGAGNCSVRFFQWGISAIPDSATITDTKIRVDITAVSAPTKCDYVQVTSDISSDTAANLWSQGTTGTIYVDNDMECYTVGNDKIIDLGASADSYLQSTLSSDRFAVAARMENMTRDAVTHYTEFDGFTQDLQVTYTVPPATYELKPFQSDGTTVIGSGRVLKQNASNTETMVINSTGWVKSTDVSYGEAYNYTVVDATDSFVNNMTINKRITSNQAQTGTTNIFPTDCGAADTDFQIKPNFTAYHTMTSTTPTCDANGDISFTTTDTARGIGPASNQTRKIIARIIDTAEYDWLPGKMTANGTVITGTYLTNVVNFTGIQIGNGYQNRVMNFVIFTDNVTSQPTALSGTPTSETNVNLSWTAPSDLHGDAVQSYRIWRDGVIIQNSTGSAATTYSDTLAGPGGTTHTYQVCAWNRIGCSPYSATASVTTYTGTSGTIALVTGNVGDTVNINATITVSAGAPTPFTVQDVRLYRNNTLVYTNTTDITISTVGGTGLSRIWYQITNDDLNVFHVQATLTNATGTVNFSSTNSNVTREYDPGYINADDNPAVEGLVNYTLTRFDDEDGVHLKVNREGGTLTQIWTINCIVQTNVEAQATRNQSLTWPGTWRNFTDVGYFNSTWTDLTNTHAYVTCFNPPGQLFTTISYTNSSLALFGIQVFDDSYGAMLGVPVGIFFLALAGGMANKRTAPTWIVVLLGMAGIMATIGFFTLTPIVWGLALVTGLLGLLVNQKVF